MSVLTGEELQAMFMSGEFTPQDVERLLVSHAILVRNATRGMVALMEIEEAEGRYSRTQWLQNRARRALFEMET